MRDSQLRTNTIAKQFFLKSNIWNTYEINSEKRNSEQNILFQSHAEKNIYNGSERYNDSGCTKMIYEKGNVIAKTREYFKNGILKSKSRIFLSYNFKNKLNHTVIQSWNLAKGDWENIKMQRI